MALLPYNGASSIPFVREAALNNSLVVLDVDGGIFDENDVQSLMDNQVITAANGQVVRIHAEPEVILERAADRDGYVDIEDIHEWNKNILNTEEAIRLHNLKYFMIDGGGPLEDSVIALAIRMGLTR